MSLIGTDLDTSADYVIGKAITNGTTTLVVAAQTDEAANADRDNLRIAVDADNSVPLTVPEGVLGRPSVPTP